MTWNFLVILFFMLPKSYAKPNSVDFGGVVLSTDDKHLSHEIEEHTIATGGNKIVKDDLSKLTHVISDFGQDMATDGNVMVMLDKNGASIVQENLSAKQKEDLRQVDDVGSNMVKRLLKNYESYKTVLSDKEEDPNQANEELENTVYMQHFHKVAGAVLKDNEVNKDELKTGANEDISTANDMHLPGTTSMTSDQVNPTKNPTGSKMADKLPEEFALPVDEFDVETAEVKVVLIDNEENLNDDMKADIKKMLEDGKYIASEADNTDNSDNVAVSDENGERDGRIVNVGGQRRRISSPGATRISSGNSLGSQEPFRPRPVYPASSPSFSQQPSSVFSGFPTQDIHIHQTEDAVFIPDSNVDVHIHNHPIPVSNGGLEFAEEEYSDEEGGLIDWISDLLGKK